MPPSDLLHNSFKQLQIHLFPSDKLENVDVNMPKGIVTNNGKVFKIAFEVVSLPSFNFDFK